MERESGSSVPRREGTAGYEEGKWQFCTPPQRSNGVWERKVAVLYPGAREHRGKERESCSSVPRRKEPSGYGEGKLQFCTPPRGNSGVRRGKVAVLYPAARNRRGMKPEVRELPAIWKDLKYYEESGRKNEGDGRNL